MRPIKKANKEKVKSLVICALIVIPFVVFFLCAGSFLVSSVDIRKNLINPISICLLILACFCSSYFCVKYLKKHGLFTGAIIGFLIFVPLFVAAVLSGGVMSLAAFYKLIMCITAGGLGGSISVAVMSGRRKMPKRSSK